MRLETGRLSIRDFTLEDYNEIHRYTSDPEVTRYMLWGPNTEEETQTFIRENIVHAQASPRTRCELAVIWKETGRIAGCCGLFLSGSNAEIGYWLASPFWGRGIATEAAGALLAYGFEQPGVHRIYATCRPENAGSARVLEKLGMKQEGVMREHVYWRGRWQSSLLYSVLKSEYSAALAD